MATVRTLTDNQTAALRALDSHGSWSPRDRVWVRGNVSATWRMFDVLATRGLVLRRTVDDTPIFTLTDDGRVALRVTAEPDAADDRPTTRSAAQCHHDAVTEIGAAHAALRRAVAALDDAGEHSTRKRLTPLVTSLAAILDTLD